MDRRVAKLEQSVAVARGPDYRCAGSVQPECYVVVRCDKHTGRCHSSTVCVEGNSWFGDSSDESGDDSWFGGGGLSTRNKGANKRVAAPPAPAPVAPPPAVPAPTAPPPTTPPKRERKEKESRRTRKSATETLQQEVDTKAKI